MTKRSNFTYSDLLRRHQVRTVAVDLLVLLVSFRICNQLRWKNPLPINQIDSGTSFMIVMIFCVWLFALSVNGVWELSAVENLQVGTGRVVSASIFALFVSATIAYLLKEPISRVWLLGIVLSSAVILLICRVIFGILVFKRKLKKANIQHRYLVIVKAGLSFKEGDLPKGEKELPSTHEILTIPKNVKWDVWVEKLKKLLEGKKFDGLIITEDAIATADQLNEISELYNYGISTLLIKSKVLAVSNRVRPIRNRGWYQIVEPEVTSNSSVLKRAFDIIFAALLLVLLSPIFLITAILVKVTSDGPILYIADRVGQNNVLFKFPKFRSMYSGADNERQKILAFSEKGMSERYREDPRITKLGKFIRRWSIDELPQIYCVLIGTMSVVGPRPILPEELNQIGRKSSFRFVAKPGLTGLWQVSGRKEVEWQERMDQDSFYIHNWNFLTDFILIGKTIGAIFSGKGAM